MRIRICDDAEPLLEGRVVPVVHSPTGVGRSRPLIIHE